MGSLPLVGISRSPPAAQQQSLSRGYDGWRGRRLLLWRVKRACGIKPAYSGSFRLPVAEM